MSRNPQLPNFARLVSVSIFSVLLAVTSALPTWAQNSPNPQVQGYPPGQYPPGQYPPGRPFPRQA